MCILEKINLTYSEHKFHIKYMQITLNTFIARLLLSLIDNVNLKKKINST